MMDPRSLTLTLILAAAAGLSPSPSPSPAVSFPPPKQLRAHPAVAQISPPPHHHRHHTHHHTHHSAAAKAAVASPPHRGRSLNSGQLAGIVLAAVAVALQVALGVFLVYKRIQLRKAESRERLPRL